eukprot:905182-Ditylum_brightwellii.AAC.1
MERKQCVPPFVTFGLTKRPTVGVPEGSWKAAHSGGRREPFIRMNKQAGERGAPKHGRYLVEMYNCVGKWTVRFGDGLCDLLLANGFSCYCAVNVGNNDIRRRGQAKFITEALEEGLKWVHNSLDNKKNIHPDYD